MSTNAPVIVRTLNLVTFVYRPGRFGARTKCLKQTSATRILKKLEKIEPFSAEWGRLVGPQFFTDQERLRYGMKPSVFYKGNR